MDVIEQLKAIYVSAANLQHATRMDLDRVYQTRKNRGEITGTFDGKVIYHDVTVSCGAFMYAQMCINKMIGDLVNQISNLSEELSNGNSDTNGGNNQTQTNATATGDDAGNVAHQSAG